MKNIFLAFTMLVVWGCRHGIDIPPELIQKDQMTSILIDVHILESKVNDLKLPFDSSRLLYNTLEQDLFIKHGVSEEKYKLSYQFYVMNVDLLDEVYATVVDSLNFMEKSGRLPVLFREGEKTSLPDSIRGDSLNRKPAIEPEDNSEEEVN